MTALRFIIGWLIILLCMAVFLVFIAGPLFIGAWLVTDDETKGDWSMGA